MVCVFGLVVRLVRILLMFGVNLKLCFEKFVFIII